VGFTTPAGIRRFHVVDHDRPPLEGGGNYGEKRPGGRAGRRRGIGEKALEL